MDIIWVNRLIAGTKTWDAMPAFRQNNVKTILAERVENNDITADLYQEITGEAYEA